MKPKTDATAVKKVKAAGKNPATAKAVIVPKPAKQRKEPKQAGKEKPAMERGVVEETDDEVISLQNDDGKVINFHHVATIDYEDKWYVFFQPIENMEGIEDDEVLVFKLETDEEKNDVFLPVEDDDLLNEIYAKYVRMVEECKENISDGCDEGSCGTCCGCEKGNAKQ
jgi:uncharacterized protein YrzB (UPF0473 family)